ncbi:gsl1469 [Gloeobacter violaceus PCC 7421]|uniref:Gsl1469 protein n=1 Tax=Gloeobacter violaceus (strain ATCC 29082 / PCC 7421) TaxID=251221 RepID=Q7NKK8_GLOVI|nr:gsl1469 [Gloeobacter violaceus PCC 7421]
MVKSERFGPLGQSRRDGVSDPDEGYANFNHDDQTLLEKTGNVDQKVVYKEVHPKYFHWTLPDGRKIALHHVHDASKISNMIRAARCDENGNRIWW